MNKIDIEIVRHVALLSRLELTEKELKLYSNQLTSILSYINKLNQIDTKDVLPTSHALSTLKNVFRKDGLKPSLKTDDVLRNAPSKKDTFFRVPKVIESSAEGSTQDAAKGEIRPRKRGRTTTHLRRETK